METSSVDWYAATYKILWGLLERFLIFLPKLLGVVIIFLVGWIFASGIGGLITEILNRLKFNKIFERTGWSEAFRRAGLKVNLSEFFGAIVKWTLVIVSLLLVADILGLKNFTIFLREDIIGFLANVVVAALIFVVAIILGDILEKITVASVEKAGIGYAKLTGLLVRWAIWGFAILTILAQLGIGKAFVLVLFQGIVALFVISFGLAFGLGGKDIAAEILRELREKLR